MRDWLLRLRFPTMVVGICLSLWGIYAFAQLRSEAGKGQWPAQDPHLWHRSLEAAHNASGNGD